jgi:hypothetical protein
MVTALFPERRPVSGSVKDIHISGLRSSASSISGMSTITTGGSSLSQSLSMAAPRNAFDNASIVSNSGSSVISDTTTSREPLLDENTIPTNYEDDGFELRIATYEMNQALGVDGTVGCSVHVG